ncbi:hypothetical protein [Paenibacillus mendelii]|uniref:Uncharacterized protein n=1 Tax=Paenibacillus mendelii TaxID=206163 RepID=A0ABV6JHQ4_9BACL|nr:hypothetical protein [Paenibacillus mendelii]MCQ6558328.1 hypothetical protein [Paenibacillus mendelii]
MREFIEFITNNFFFVILVVGFIFSLFSKMKKGEPNRRMPDFGGAGTPGLNRPRPAAAEVQRSEEQLEPERPVYTTSFQDAKPVDRDSEYSFQTSYAAERAPAKPASARSIPSAAVRNAEGSREQGVHSLKLSSRDELARAVLMAEVLGPPRAKKPLNRR